MTYLTKEMLCQSKVISKDKSKFVNVDQVLEAFYLLLRGLFGLDGFLTEVALLLHVFAVVPLYWNGHKLVLHFDMNDL